MWKDDEVKRFWDRAMPYLKVRELISQVQDLFCLLKDLCEIVGDLWREPHAESCLADDADKSRWISCNQFWSCLSRARIIYVFYFLKIAFTLHTACVLLLIFIGLECEGLDFKVFTWAVKHSHGRWTIVKGWNNKPSHRKSIGNQEVSDIFALYAVNTWISKPSHLKPLKIRDKNPSCEGVNAFLRIKKRIGECTSVGRLG